jgi:chromosome partitioning protein
MIMPQHALKNIHLKKKGVPMSEIGECIAFANYKGGTGKTTSCLSIAGFLAKGGSKVLLIDFDPQASATSGIGIDKLTVKHSMYDAILSQCDGYAGMPLKNIILETDVENLHLAPSEWDLAAAEVIMQNTPGKVNLLHTLTRSVQSCYDYILIDTPPSSGLLLMNCFVAADHVIIPFDPGVFSLEAIDNLKTAFLDVKRNTGHNFNKIIVVLTRYVEQDPLERLFFGDNPSRQVKKMLEGTFKSVFVVPESPEIYRSQQQGKPISHYAPKSKAGKAYKQIADAIKGES